MDITEKIRETVKQHSMIPNGARVIAGLSGGADSVCLLRLLSDLSKDMDFTLCAVHVNHCLRGEESDRDQRFCEELCAKLDIPIAVYRVNVSKYAAQTGKSTEEAARILRYDAFEQAAEHFGGGITATAHNSGDNAETVLFNIIRGTGLKGLCGIPYVRGSIIRPLLDISREEIEKYLSEIGQDFVTDSTNLTEDYSRNKIRRIILPMLREINPGADKALCRLSRSVREDEAFLSEITENADISNIADYPPSVRKRYIRKLFEENSVPVDSIHIEETDNALMSGRKTRVNIKEDIFAVTDGKTVRIEKIGIKNPFETAVILGQNYSIDIPDYDKQVIIERLHDDIFQNEGIVNEKLTNNLVNCDKIQGVVVLRNKRDGDSIRLAHHDCTTKLKKLYNSLKLPLSERQTALVMEDEEGLIWSEYGGVCGRVCPENGGSGCGYANICKITVRRRSNDP